MGKAYAETERERSKDVARSYRYRVDAAVNKQRDETRMKEMEKEGRRERGKRKGERKRGLGEGAPAWVCRRGGVTTVSPTQPLLRRFYPRPRLTDQPLQLPRHFEFGSVQSSCTTLPLLWKAAHKGRRQLPLIVSSAPAEISQTFVRLNGLKRHTPAHLRAPVRARSLWTFQVRFPFLPARRIIKSNAIPGDRRPYRVHHGLVTLPRIEPGHRVLSAW